MGCIAALFPFYFLAKNLFLYLIEIFIYIYLYLSNKQKKYNNSINRQNNTIFVTTILTPSILIKLVKTV